jgi:hypothetical protein
LVGSKDESRVIENGNDMGKGEDQRCGGYAELKGG